MGSGRWYSCFKLLLVGSKSSGSFAFRTSWNRTVTVMICTAVQWPVLKVDRQQLRIRAWLGPKSFQAPAGDWTRVETRVKPNSNGLEHVFCMKIWLEIGRVSRKSPGRGPEACACDLLGKAAGGWWMWCRCMVLKDRKLKMVQHIRIYIYNMYIYIYYRQIKQYMFLIFCFYLGYQWDEYWINDQSILVAIHHTNLWDNDVHWDVNGIMLFYTMPMFLKVDINGVHMGYKWDYMGI